MLKKLQELLRGADAPTESDSGRDGFLSYAAEWHSFTHGVYDGLRDWRIQPKEPPDIPDVQAELPYYKGGYLLSSVIQVMLPVILWLLRLALS